MSTPTRQVLLPEPLCAAIERRFGSVETFLPFVMEEILRNHAEALDQNEQRIIEERLRDLGYI